jgi:hypothetical protein
LIHLLSDSMDFHDKTLTLEVLNPEVRYVFEYDAKGKMFLLPIDTSGAGSGTACEFFFWI